MNFLIVDDHPMIREGMVAVLKQFAPAADILQAGNGDSAIAKVQGTPQPGREADDTASAAVNCVLMDLNMPGLSGLSTLARMRELAPTLPILVFSSSEDPADVRRAFAAGASGFCPKSSGNDTLMAALRMVMDGHQYIPPLMLLSQPLDAGSSEPRSLSPLTDRQTEVLALIAQGLPNKLIARELDMQEKTVKGHVSAIFRALGAVNRVQAVEAARQAGLLSSHPS